jgi:hypothetical protein
MTDESKNFPELITDANRFTLLKGECEKVIDIRKRLPDFIFKKTFARYYVIEHGLISHKQFGHLLSTMASTFGDESINYITLIPDAVDYYYERLGFYGLASFESAAVEERFLPVMWRGRVADSFIARGGDVAALWGSSLNWAIAADRISWEMSVIGASASLDITAITGFPCFNGAQVGSYVRSQYHAQDPTGSIAISFTEKFLANYPV